MAGKTPNLKRQEAEKDIHRPLHTIAAEHTFFSVAQETFPKYILF
jgi:hypothetical protein